MTKELHDLVALISRLENDEVEDEATWSSLIHSRELSEARIKCDAEHSVPVDIDISNEVGW